jgi:hypothetical protein
MTEPRWGCTLCHRLGHRWPDRCGVYGDCGRYYVEADDLAALEAQNERLRAEVEYLRMRVWATVRHEGGDG